MSPIFIITLTLLVVLTLCIPNKYILLPLIIVALHTPYTESALIGPIRIHIIHIIAFITFLRTKQSPGSKKSFNNLDFWLFATSLALIVPTITRGDGGTSFVFNSKTALTYILVYLTFKQHISTIKDYQLFAKMVAIAIIPLAISMVIEQRIGHNLYSFFETVNPMPQLRNGRLRAQGPFTHAILAGTIGSVCIFISFSINEKRWKRIGITASTIVVMACASSGPIAGLMAGVFALYIKRFRHLIKYIAWTAPVLFIILEIVMTRSPIYIISYIDFTGSSTSWYRARLIESAFEHFGEWWLNGTDYTRHWMPTGVTFSPNHTDITCHYIAMGVAAGSLPFIAFIILLVKAFKTLKQTLIHVDLSAHCAEWCIGAALFSLAISITCVSLFDNSIVFLLALIGTISGLSNSIAINTTTIKKT